VTARIAVVLDGPPTPAWQAQALEGLRAIADIEIVEVRLAGPVRSSRTRRLRHALERHFFPGSPDALAHVEVRESSDAGADAALTVWLSERPAAAGGSDDLVWLRHGGVDGPSEDAFARALAGGLASLESEVMLRRQGDVLVAARTVSEVRSFSETLSRTMALWKLAGIVPRAVERLPGLAQAASESQEGAPRPPRGGALLARAAAAALRAVVVRLLYRRPWSIRVRRRGAAALRAWGADEGLVRWREGHIYADPILFEHDGRHHLFCEEIPHGSTRGVISHTELRPGGAPADPPECVLSAPCHLSYPFVFADGEEVFMIPETSALGRVELYRAIAFPHRWEPDTVLLDGLDATDATVARHDGRLWLFVSVAAPHASSLDELHLFWADALRGPWHPHPLNPVVSDARCARPAGPVQRWGERLVRPGQDGSRRYGWAVSVREIDVLSTTAYAEHEIERIEPGDVRGARATHTYASDSRFEAIDLRRRRLRLRR
jgi:hypothetical protein